MSFSIYINELRNLLLYQVTVSPRHWQQMREKRLCCCFHAWQSHKDILE